jgi:hypothetical protein
MKNLIAIIIITLSLLTVSCGPTEKYYYEQIAAFVANDEAAFTMDSISCYHPILESFVKEPFAQLNGGVYYPRYDMDGCLYYTLARR